MRQLTIRTEDVWLGRDTLNRILNDDVAFKIDLQEILTDTESINQNSKVLKPHKIAVNKENHFLKYTLLE